MGEVWLHGTPPYGVAVIHGGPGAGGEMAPVARELARYRGVLEPIQTAMSLDGQVEELRGALWRHGHPPMVLVGFSWGAWLSFILAARYPKAVGKLILVGSGPFREKYVARLRETRMSRLSGKERRAFDEAIRALKDPTTEDRDAYLAQLGALARKSDTYKPIADRGEMIERIGPKGDVFKSVWQEAAQLRRRGELLELGRNIECPVVAIHGDYDPHPAEGVREPLEAVLKRFHFILLEHCGHRPWVEREARGAFFRLLEEEVP